MTDLTPFQEKLTNDYYYGYDEKIEAKIYILYKHHLNLGLPAWLHEYKISRLSHKYESKKNITKQQN